MTERKYRFRQAKNRAFQVVVHLLSFLALAPLLLILWHIVSRGLRYIDWGFLTRLPTPPNEWGDGIANALVGSLVMVSMAAAVAVPLGVAAGVCLAQARPSRFIDLSRLAVDVLQGMPSVVIGILLNLWVVQATGRFSALAGGLALGVMMLPLVVRGTEEVLKLVPSHLLEASYALGVPRYRTVLKVLIPCGLPGILSAVLMGVSRVAGETAPLLFTAFGNPLMETDPFKPMDALPKLIYKSACSPWPDDQAVAWGASVVLIFIVLSTNILSRLVIKKWSIRF